MNVKEFKGKVALVTGASRGIGKAISMELAKNGATIAINYNSDLLAAKETLKLIKNLEVNSEIFKADVSKEKDVNILIKKVEKKLGPIDLLVTNAGVLHLSKDFLELDYKIWKKTMATNVDGTLLPIKEVLPGMIKRKFGRIVCISSVAGLGMRPNMITYGTSKAAVIALVRNLSSAVAPYIRINSVAPGLIETDMAKLFDKKTKKNIFYNSKDKFGMSDIFKSYVAGQIKFLSDISIFLAPNINSYKRFQEGSFAPTKSVWGIDNRTAGFRLAGHGSSIRIECRVPGADVNPYLAFAALVGAGLYGIKNKLKLEEPYSGNIYEKKVREVPKTLNEAIQLAKKSKLLPEIFHSDVLDHYIHAAEWEQKDYDLSVNDWQLRRYFERG